MEESGAAMLFGMMAVKCEDMKLRRNDQTLDID